MTICKPPKLFAGGACSAPTNQADFVPAPAAADLLLSSAVPPTSAFSLFDGLLNLGLLWCACLDGLTEQEDLKTVKAVTCFWRHAVDCGFPQIASAEEEGARSGYQYLVGDVKPELTWAADFEEGFLVEGRLSRR